MKKFWLIPAVTLLTLSSAFAAGEECSAPGVLVLEDATGDSGVQPDPTVPRTGNQPFFDIQTLHMSEPAGMAGKLVFTYKMSSLSTLPPQTAYILRFSSDIAPDNGDDDFFVAMVTDVSGEARFVYGSDGFEFGLPAGEPRQFHITGDLDPASNFNADGTITLVLDKAAVPGITKGAALFNILPTVRLVTPPGDAPFFTNADNNTILDEVAESGFYDVAGDGCAGKSGLERVLAGAWSPFALLMLLVPALLRRR